ncbi:uncharacterized protein [Palaemon carinicauda]|uniref:uncharacterized protein n=1 Tax=Palaemon carinicauda TaxID=392227 RepID=UPI0035B5DCE4
MTCIDVTEGAGPTQVIGEHQFSGREMKQIISRMKAASFHPTLPPEIATDAAIYVAVIVIFYAAIIILLVGTNIHRLRPSRRNRPHHCHPLPVDTSASAGVSWSIFSSSTDNPGPVSTTVIREMKNWREYEDAAVV